MEAQVRKHSGKLIIRMMEAIFLQPIQHQTMEMLLFNMDKEMHGW